MSRKSLFCAARLAVVGGLCLAICMCAQAQTTIPSHVKNRFLDGSIDASKARLKPSLVMIDSFEDPAAIAKDWDLKKVQAQPSDQHATEGKKSLQVKFADKDSVARYLKGSEYWGPPVDWSLQVLFNNEAQLDVFNAEDHPVKLMITLGKKFTFDLKPGANHLVMPTREMVREVFRTTLILQNTRISVDDPKPATLYMDNFHWVGTGLGENLIKDAKCFDFGGSTADLNLYVRPYFKQVGDTTMYTKQAGYGWLPCAADDLFKKIEEMPSSGRQPHDQLIRDYLYRINRVLVVDLPDGVYRVQLVDGNIFSGQYSVMPCDYDLSFKVGDTVTPIRKRADFAGRLAYYYGRDRVDYLPGEDKWSKYMSDWFSPVEGDVTVKGGQLKLELLTNPPGHAVATFMIIYPVAKAPQIEPELAALWKDIRAQFNELAYQQASVEIATKMNLPGLHEEFVDPAAAAARHKALKALPAAKDGLVVFHRDCDDDVYADTVPKPDDICGSVSAFAPRGEIASLAINLHAMKDIQKLSVELGDFVTADGKKIAAKQCDLRFVRYSYRMTGMQGHGDWTYMIAPWHLVKRSQIDMVDGMSVRWWLNVDVPADAAAGTYTARAKITGGGLAPREIKLNLDVLPFALDGLPKGMEYSTAWGLRQQWGPVPDGGTPLRAFKMPAPEGAKLTAEVREKMTARCKAEFTLMKRYGLNKVYDHIELDEEWFKSSMLPADVLGILPIEPVEKSGGRAYVAGSGNFGRVTTLQRLTEKDVAAVKAAKGEAMLFGPVMGYVAVQQEPGTYRFCSGFYMWRLGATGALYDPWQNYWGDPYHPFDGHSGEWGSLCIPASTDWPTMNPTILLEGIREGITDYRYLVTLERLLKEKPTHAAAAKAKQYLQGLRESLKPQASEYFAPSGAFDLTWRQKDTAWKAADYLAARKTIAELIGELSR